MAQNKDTNNLATTLIVIGAVCLFTPLIPLGVILIVIGMVLLLDEKKPKQSLSQVRNVEEKANQSGLQVRVVQNTRVVEGVSYEFCEFEVKGVLTSQAVAWPTAEVRLYDVTDSSDSHPVYSHHEDFQEAGSRTYLGSLDLDTALHAGSGSEDWVVLMGVPMIVLDFPHSGLRKVKVVFSLYERLSPQHNLTSTESTFDLALYEKGYLELMEVASAAHCESLKLAMCIAAADGKFDDCEVEVIKSWGDRMVSDLNPIQKALKRDQLNEALSFATSEIRDGRREELENRAADKLHSIGEKPFLYEAYELCLHVLKADGEAHPEEIAQLSRLSERMGLDKNKVRLLSNTHLADVQYVGSGADDSDEKMLGVTPNMTPEEAKRHLRKESKKYQARSTHADPKIRNQAKQMLEVIGNLRAKYSE